jgi:hypothetical protein
LIIIILMKKILLFLLIAFFLSPVFSAVNAASFSFDKSSYSVSTGQTFQVQINIDAGEDQVNGADAYINYDNSFLSVENISAGSFFTTVTNDVNTPGKVYIAGLVDDPASSKTGSGTLATITFKGLKDGTVNLTFDCNNSKIVKNDANATNILQCAVDNKAVVTVGSSNSGSSDSSSNSSNNNQPKTLPKSGIFENLINFAIPGAILFLIGGGLKLFILK